MGNRARIKLASADTDKLNDLVGDIIDIAKKTNTQIKGPISLPTKRLKITTRKSPCGNGKATYDRYEMRIHKRLLDLGVNERALRLIMRVPMPKGVNIEIEMI